MRVSTAFNTMLAIPGSSVIGVCFEPTAVVAPGSRPRSAPDLSRRAALPIGV